MWKYDVYYDKCWLHEDGDYETESEALEEAQAYIDGKEEDWDFDGTEWDSELFEIITSEV